MSISNKGGNFLISYENFENTMDSILDKEEYLKKNNIEIQRVEDTSDTSDTSVENMEILKNEEDNEIIEERVEEPVEEPVEEIDTTVPKSMLIRKNELLL